MTRSFRTSSKRLIGENQHRRHLEAAEDSTRMDQPNAARSTAIETAVWGVLMSLIALVIILLLVPSMRSFLHSGLKLVDIMAMSHRQPEFAALRKISTPSGGLFTIMAISIALGSSANLVLQFTFSNFITTNNLQVAADGVTGADQAALATSDILLDVIVRPASFVPCSESLQLVVSSGQASASSSIANASALTLFQGSLVQMASTAQLTQLDEKSSAVCWLRASCGGCSLKATVSIEAQAHWSVQIVGWRLAALDATGTWSTTGGVAVPPVLDSKVQNASQHRAEMLDTQSEVVGFVSHLLDDQRGSSPINKDGIFVQNRLAGSAESRAVDSIDPSKTTTNLRIRVERSTVFATSRITPVFTLAQLVSSILGLALGILGGFKVAFAVFEWYAGSSFKWLLGHTGVIGSEDEAIKRKKDAEGNGSKPVPTTQSPLDWKYTPKAIALKENEKAESSGRHMALERGKAAASLASIEQKHWLVGSPANSDAE